MNLNVLKLRLGNACRTKNTHVRIYIGLAEMQYLMEEPMQTNLEPIPLDEKVLDELGFEKYHVGHKMEDLYLDDLNILHRVDSERYGVIIARGVDTVHRLQNIIMALEGKELEFKENKPYKIDFGPDNPNEFVEI